MIKKLFPIVMMALLIGCGDDEVAEFTSERMNITDREVVLGADVTSAFVSVDANCQWTAQLKDGWERLTINPTQGGINIVSPENTQPVHRSATLTVTSQSGKLIKTLTVSQNAAGVSIDVSVDALDFIGEADETTVLVVSNADWQLSGDNEWCHVSPTSGAAGSTEVTVRVDANPNESTRRNPLVFNAASGEARQTLQVTQAPPSVLRFATTESVVRTTAMEGTYQINVAGTAEWVPMISYEASENASQGWLHIVSPQSSVKGEGTIVIKCDDNATKKSQRATITLVWSRMTSIPVQITVEQAAAKAPVVAPVSVSSVDRHIATITSGFSSEFPVKRFGIYYTTDRTHEPGPGDEVIEYSGSQLSGEIRILLENLVSGRRYYVRAFAESDVDITYSEVTYFTTTGDAPSEDDNKPMQDV